MFLLVIVFFSIQIRYIMITSGLESTFISSLPESHPRITARYWIFSFRIENSLAHLIHLLKSGIYVHMYCKWPKNSPMSKLQILPDSEDSVDI